MKKYITSYIILFISLCANIIAFDNIPDYNSTINSSHELLNIDFNATVQPTSTTQYLKPNRDANTTSSKDYKSVTLPLIHTTKNKFGKTRINDMNLSNSSYLKSYSNELIKKTPSRVQSTIDSLRGGSDTREVKRDKIFDKLDANSTTVRALTTFDSFYQNVRSRRANRKTINCFINRKINYSYYCPLPTKDHSYFYGGAVGDSKDDSKKACEKDCWEQSSCLSAPRSGKTQTNIIKKDTVIAKPETINLQLDGDVRLDKIELQFDVKYKYDSNVSIDSKDYKSGEARKAIVSRNLKIRYDFSYLNEANATVDYVSSRGIQIKDNFVSNTIYFGDTRAYKGTLTISVPYSEKGGVEAEDENLTLKLTNIIVTYLGDKYWFCPAEHFVASSSKCSGVVKSLNIGGVSYNVCVTDATKRREPKYGAYYTESECQSSCKLRAECKPTYRHLTSTANINAPADVREFTIGCVTDDPSNTSCTDQKCQDLFLSDKMPLVEKTWRSNDKIVYTVQNGIQNSDETRPRLDVAGGISAGNDISKQKKVEVKEMAELSYQDMIERENYNVSHYTVGTEIPARNSLRKIKGSDGKLKVFWRLRADSYDYDNSTKYLYEIFEVSMQYPLKKGFISTKDGTIYASEKNPLLALDKVYLLKTSSGSYKVIKYVEFDKIKIPVSGTNGSSDTYEWRDVPEYKTIKYETFNGANYAVYDKSSGAEYIRSMVFDASVPIMENLAFNGIGEIIEQGGVYFHSQSASSSMTSFTRNFTGPVVDSEKSTLQGLTAYGFYSKTPLSYEEVLQRAIRKNAFYSTSYKVSENILSDGEYDTNNVQMFISGRKNKFNVSADFNPSGEENGKKTFIFMLLFDD